MSAYLVQLGARMQRLAREAGYETTTALAVALGKPASSNPTVSKWFRGEARPNQVDLERFCKLVGVSMEELLGDQERVAAQVAEALFEIVERTLKGEDLAQAFDAVVGYPAALSLRERRLLSAGARQWQRQGVATNGPES